MEKKRTEHAKFRKKIACQLEKECGRWRLNLRESGSGEWGVEGRGRVECRGRLLMIGSDMLLRFLLQGFADGATAPVDFPLAPTIAVNKLLAVTGMRIQDIHWWEINEAFSAVALVNIKLLGLDRAKVNPQGGAVSLGHPVGFYFSPFSFLAATSPPSISFILWHPHPNLKSIISTWRKLTFLRGILREAHWPSDQAR